MIIPRWQISAGEVSEWLPPGLFALAALASAWVLFDTRRRRFSLYAVAAWTLATLAAPPIVLPLYLLTKLLKQADDGTETAAPATEQFHESLDNDGLTQLRARDENNELAESVDLNQLIADNDITDDETNSPAQVSVAPFDPPHPPPAKKLRAALSSAYAPPVIYALVALSLGALYFYRDYHSFDAYLARAASAKLTGPPAKTIRIYRDALRLSDDAHTHKLLALELAADHQPAAALTEFRAAERLGDPDALLPFHLANALDALGRHMEAKTEFSKFASSDWCVRPQPDPRCAEASARIL